MNTFNHCRTSNLILGAVRSELYTGQLKKNDSTEITVQANPYLNRTNNSTIFFTSVSGRIRLAERG